VDPLCYWENGIYNAATAALQAECTAPPSAQSHPRREANCGIRSAMTRSGPTAWRRVRGTPYHFNHLTLEAAKRRSLREGLGIADPDS
jgi:hypothetical protein